MQVHPRIEALQGDPASQRRCAAAMAAALAQWLGGEEVQTLRRELAVYSASGRLEDCPLLARLLHDHSQAAGFVAGVTGTFLGALRAEPLAEVPLRRSSGEGFSRVQLLAEGGAVLSLCAYEPGGWQGEPETVQFADCTACEIVLAGVAKGMFYELRDDRIHSSAHLWRAGDRICRMARTGARHVLAADPTLLTLQLTRVTKSPSPSHEYRLRDSALVRRTSGDRRASEQVMALAVLGAMGAAHHAGPIGDFARDPLHDTDARWEAVRQLVALDAGAGFGLLCELAQRDGDPLAAPARGLRDTLREAHPVLCEPKEEPA